MQLFVTVKAAGKRRPVLENIPYEIEESPNNLGELLDEVVKNEVEKYNEKSSGENIITILTGEQLDNMASAGKVSFGAVYTERRADLPKAQCAVRQAFCDGIIRVIINGKEAEALEDRLEIEAGSELVFIRMTLLTGRLW